MVGCIWLQGAVGGACAKPLSIFGGKGSFEFSLKCLGLLEVFGRWVQAEAHLHVEAVQRQSGIVVSFQSQVVQGSSQAGWFLLAHEWRPKSAWFEMRGRFYWQWLSLRGLVPPHLSRHYIHASHNYS